MDANREPIYSINEDKTFIFPSINGNKKVTVQDLIGAGGTWLAYKCFVEDGDAKEYAVIKEYYPYGISAKYIRDGSNGELHIEDDSEEKREKEIQKQNDDVKRELEINHALYLRNDNNNPYMYSAELYCNYGDSTYVLIDTSEGQTLKKFINSHRYNELTVRERINLAISYSKKFLIILNHIFSDDYIHGDLKPENIYISGKSGAENFYFLDYGSVFSKNEYRIDIETASDDEIIEVADRIIQNEGIGMSSDGYRNSDMISLLYEKNNYYAMKGSVISATDLLNAINKIDVSADIYCIVKILYLLAIGKEYDSDVESSELKKELYDCNIIVDELLRIMEKNKEEGYHSIEEIMNDLDILEALLNRRGHPKTLLYGLQNQVKNNDIDVRLFGEIISD